MGINRKNRQKNGKKREETGRNGERKRMRKKTTNSIDDNKIMQPLGRGSTRRQGNKNCDI